MAAHNNAQTGLMGTYDANNVYFTIDGKTAYGYGATTLYTFSYDNDLLSVQQDPQGTGTASINNKTGGTFTLTINQMSPFNKIIDDLADERRVGGYAVDACDGSRHYVGAHAYIQKKPDGGAANEAGERTITVKVLNVVENSVL